MSGNLAQQAGRQPFLIATRAFLLWAMASLFWMGYWARYFYDYCDFGEVSSCVAPQGQWAASYSVAEIIELVLGVPAVLLLIPLAIGWGRARHALQLTERTAVSSSQVAGRPSD